MFDYFGSCIFVDEYLETEPLPVEMVDRIQLSVLTPNFKSFTN